MLHDIVLALGGIGGDVLKDLLNDDLMLHSLSIHPCEKSLLKLLINIADKYKRLQVFMKKVSHFGNEDISLGNGIEIKAGMYIRAFCDGLYECLEPYRRNVIVLEKDILQNPHISLSGVLAQVREFTPLLDTLNSIINQIGSRKLHGCKLLQLIHQYLFSGIDLVDTAMARIMKKCHMVMLKQLTGWLLYGNLTDPYSEFFIESCPTSSRESMYSSMTTLDSESLPEDHLYETVLTDVAIIPDLVPNYIPLSSAEKAKTIGQRVLLFSQDPQVENRQLHDALIHKMESSLLEQLSSLQDSLTLDISFFESSLNTIQSFVTQHLFILAKDKANLMGELQIIRDFYLTGRGELYFSFLPKAKQVLFKSVNSNSCKELNKHFSSSMREIQLNSDAMIEKLYFKLPSKEAASESNTWSAMTLHYKPPWPLHLLFHPATLTMYNTIFKFLLQVKFTELNLHNAWIDNAKRKDNPLPATVWNLRNNLTFLVHNLQCYLQLDIIESEYSILIKELQNIEDFEQVIHHHTKFLTHISSQSFLLTHEVNVPDQPTLVKRHPVNKCLVTILKLCEEFCEEVSKNNPQLDKFKQITEELDRSVSILMNLIAVLDKRASSLHLLLLRLDYNRYFSTRNN